MNDTRKDEIIRLWHLARVAGHSSRYDRMVWVKREFIAAHPSEASRPKSLWLEIDEDTRPFTTLGASATPAHHATVLP